MYLYLRGLTHLTPLWNKIGMYIGVHIRMSHYYTFWIKAGDTHSWLRFLHWSKVDADPHDRVLERSNISEKV